MVYTNKQFIKRRQLLSKKLDNTLVFISANLRIQSSADIAFKFRQDSNFFYLSGLDIPNLIIVIDTTKNESQILLPVLNDYQVEWDGDFDLQKITSISGITKFGKISDIKKLIKNAKQDGYKIAYLKPYGKIIYPYGIYANPARYELEKNLLECNLDIKDLLDVRKEIAELRQVKSKEEIEEIKQQIDVTGETLKYIKNNLNYYKSEKEIQNAITAKFYELGSEGHGFEPIIANGKNASIIHYTENTDRLSSDCLILLDIGSTKGYYSADISRVYAKGKPTRRQKDIYQNVLELQNFVFNLIKPGVSVREVQELVNKQYKNHLKNLGLKPASMPHGISHHLGLDVHDATSSYSSPLEKGNVITIEPGIYIPEEGIGVRIEDNILITENGFDNLSINIDKNL